MSWNAGITDHEKLLDEAFEDIERQTRVELLPDGRVVILAMEMAEVSVRTDTHGKITVTVEETDREFYRKSYTLTSSNDSILAEFFKKARDK